MREEQVETEEVKGEEWSTRKVYEE